MRGLLLDLSQYPPIPPFTPLGTLQRSAVVNAGQEPRLFDGEEAVL